MGYLIVQTLASLAVAFAIGFASAWLIQHLRAKRKVEQLQRWITEAEQVCERWEVALDRARAVLMEIDRAFGHTRGHVDESAPDSAAPRTELRGKIVHLERVAEEKRPDAGESADWRGRYERLGAAHFDAEQRVASLKTRLAYLRQQYSPPQPLRAAADLPESPSGAQEPADDLKRVSGIGPAFERTLNEMGIYRFEQLAQLSEQDLERIAAKLETFPYRIIRDRWVEQARELTRQP